MKLADLSIEQLEAVVETLESKYKAPIVSDPKMLADEERRHLLSFNAGQFSVVEDFRIALKKAREKAMKEPPRV